jgi:hypothetical protein
LEVSSTLHAPAALPLGKNSPVPIGEEVGWAVGPRASLDDVEKRKFFTLPGPELQLLGRQARSQSLYRLRYPGSYNKELYSLLNYVYIIKRIEVNRLRLVRNCIRRENEEIIRRLMLVKPEWKTRKIDQE